MSEGQEVKPLGQEQQIDILDDRSEITTTIQKALGGQLKSRDDVAFEGSIESASFSNLRMVYIPSERQENGEPSVLRLRIDNYHSSTPPNEIIPVEPLLDTNGINPAIVELSLHESDPKKDSIRILPRIVIAMEHALSPQGVLQSVRFAKAQGHQVKELTLNEAEAESNRLRREYFDKYHKEFAKATTRTPTQNDYRVFAKTAEIIEEMMKIYGEDTFQAVERN